MVEVKTKPAAKPAPTSRPIDEVQIVFLGQRISQKARYRAGHVMTELDAEIANRAVINAARAAFTEKARAMREADIPKEEIIKQFIAFLGEYEYKPAGVKEPIDPIVADALSIARGEVVAAMKANNIKVSDVKPGAVATAAKTHLKNNEARIMAMAEGRAFEFSVE